MLKFRPHKKKATQQMTGILTSEIRTYPRIILKPSLFNAPWWERYPVRARTEEDLMYDYTSAEMQITGGQMVWNEDIYSDLGTYFQASYVAQENHPFAPPQAYILYPHITPSIDDYHIWEDGHLCLARDEDMDSNTTVLDIRNWTCLWVTCYEIYMNTGEWIGLEH